MRARTEEVKSREGGEGSRVKGGGGGGKVGRE